MSFFSRWRNKQVDDGGDSQRVNEENGDDGEHADIRTAVLTRDEPTPLVSTVGSGALGGRLYLTLDDIRERVCAATIRSGAPEFRDDVLDAYVSQAKASVAAQGQCPLDPSANISSGVMLTELEAREQELARVEAEHAPVVDALLTEERDDALPSKRGVGRVLWLTLLAVAVGAVASYAIADLFMDSIFAFVKWPMLQIVLGDAATQDAAMQQAWHTSILVASSIVLIVTASAFVPGRMGWWIKGLMVLSELGVAAALMWMRSDVVGITGSSMAYAALEAAIALPHALFVLLLGSAVNQWVGQGEQAQAFEARALDRATTLATLRAAIDTARARFTEQAALVAGREEEDSFRARLADLAATEAELGYLQGLQAVVRDKLEGQQTMVSGFAHETMPSIAASRAGRGPAEPRGLPN